MEEKAKSEDAPKVCAAANVDSGVDSEKLQGQVISVLIVLGLIFASFLIASYLFKPKSDFKYQDVTIIKQKVEGIKTIFYVIPMNVNGQNTEIVLRNDPRELANISVNASRLLSGSDAWLTTYPYESGGDDIAIARNDLGMFTTKIGMNTQFALTQVPETSTFSQMACENATEYSRVFMFSIGNETKVYEDGDCVRIEGTNFNEIIRATDALVFEWLLKIRQI